jgi:hypothetical protein
MAADSMFLRQIVAALRERFDLAPSMAAVQRFLSRPHVTLKALHDHPNADAMMTNRGRLQAPS